MSIVLVAQRRNGKTFLLDYIKSHGGLLKELYEKCTRRHYKESEKVYSQREYVYEEDEKEKDEEARPPPLI